VLVTSHILADIDAHADRVVALDRGRVVIADDLDAIRHRLGGSTVSIRLSPDPRSVVADRVRLLGLGTVVSTLHDGTVTAWRSRQPLRLLATVAELDPAASDVTVRPVSLGEVLDELATWAMSPAAPPRIPPAAPPTAAAERAARRC
jgi:ABC-2 type transport system ATP-binding protein